MTSKEAFKELRKFLQEKHNEMFIKPIKLETFKGFNLDKIEQDLDRLEKINEVWHKNEPMESVDINANHLQEVYDFIHRICEENEKLKKAIDILKKVLDLRVDFYNDTDYRFVISVAGLYEDAYGGSFECISGEQYELLKEVLEND